MDDRTQQLDLTAPIPTGNTKAAASQAGATSADLWMVPYDKIHYDPADNIRAVDLAWVNELSVLMIQHGYDKGSPLHCYVRKVDGKDLFYVYKGQHRYLAAGKAIKAGKDLGKIPLVVRDSREVNRAKMVVDGYHNNRQKAASPLDLAAAIAELRDIHNYDSKQICAELNITEQTIRDAALLEKAPAELHDLVRGGAIAGTLAIEEIRTHGADKALERIVSSLSKAKEAGKSKVTKKHLTCDTKPAERAAPKATKVSDACAKQLLQALQAVLHDPVFGKLSPGTIDAVHDALTPIADLLDTVPARKTAYAIATANEHGVYTPTDVISAPKQQRTGRCPAEIRVAQISDGEWIYGLDYTIGMAGGASPCTYHEGMPTYLTRVQAIRGAVRDLTRRIETSPTMPKAKETASVRKWLDKLYAMPDPDWTPDMAQEAAK
ncbi:pyridoxal phosphate biosynthetic protein PdxJ [Burkholderia multivorans]|uniref:hypothetical protein n=1 Tax=Burkholderia multivorans TaxID=87883 RepID=UPI000277C6F4|nr:hypothetical protein [Burkholderia multivorans]AJY19477.1 putative pyridoxal phosphate biosynthetic protein PdxJ [Burkholderia multivorans ATCC BAA-247]AVR22836.1 pyridoxal phosphate biosynthetic protein PdxJ [Burkholderia multivorans]EJO63238.1 hypothetical protein BURMUCF1_2385 [Burkholderia multivorans ATCC BAA-247]MBU9495873.1 pyridoxal phosphate biosynthetic protein PdxJ [Burkholderia multivorans]MCO1436291.1 pyridoxal phosphate biosynthetic protein PdxJ [Burkholderia multivorans]